MVLSAGETSTERLTLRKEAPAPHCRPESFPSAFRGGSPVLGVETRLRGWDRPVPEGWRVGHPNPSSPPAQRPPPTLKLQDVETGMEETQPGAP